MDSDEDDSAVGWSTSQDGVVMVPQVGSLVGVRRIGGKVQLGFGVVPASAAVLSNERSIDEVGGDPSVGVLVFGNVHDQERIKLRRISSNRTKVSASGLVDRRALVVDDNTGIGLQESFLEFRNNTFLAVDVGIHVNCLHVVLDTRIGKVALNQAGNLVEDQTTRRLQESVEVRGVRDDRASSALVEHIRLSGILVWVVHLVDRDRHLVLEGVQDRNGRGNRAVCLIDLNIVSLEHHEVVGGILVVREVRLGKLGESFGVVHVDETSGRTGSSNGLGSVLEFLHRFKVIHELVNPHTLGGIVEGRSRSGSLDRMKHHGGGDSHKSKGSEKGENQGSAAM